MPTFEAYVDKDGYYINANPPGIGNITYQLTPAATTFIRDLGYDHADDLPWRLLTPLRATGHIYTNNEGVSDDALDEPLDDGILPDLSDAEASKLLEFLNTHADAPPNLIQPLHDRVHSTDDTAGDSSSFRISALTHLKAEVTAHTLEREMQSLTGCQSATATVDPTPDETRMTIAATFTTEHNAGTAASFMQDTTHTITVADHTITEWACDAAPNNLSRVAQVYRMKAILIDALLTADNLPVELTHSPLTTASVSRDESTLAHRQQCPHDREYTA